MTAVRRGTLLALVPLSVTCGRIDRPTAPTPVATPTTTSYVLCEDGMFALQYLGGEYPGSHQHDDNTIRFLFPGDGPWYAIGTLTVDLLEVRYSDMMEHSDFENAIYRRSR
jgi:hypothetical protein